MCPAPMFVAGTTRLRARMTRLPEVSGAVKVERQLQVVDARSGYGRVRPNGRLNCSRARFHRVDPR